MGFLCDVIASSPSSFNGLSTPSFSYSFIEDVSEILCERKAPIVFVREILLVECPQLSPADIFGYCLGQYHVTNNIEKCGCFS